MWCYMFSWNVFLLTYICFSICNSGNRIEIEIAQIVSWDRNHLIECDKPWSSFCLFSNVSASFLIGLYQEEKDLFVCPHSKLRQQGWLGWVETFASKRIIWSDSTLAKSFKHLITWSDWVLLAISSKHFKFVAHRWEYMCAITYGP